MEVLFDRDEQCRMDVGRMAELGRFGETFTFYICAYEQAERVQYYISERAEQIYDYRQNLLLKGMYPAPIEAYSQRFMIPAGMREGIKQSARIQFAKAVREQYPKELFRFLRYYGQVPPSDAAYQMLADIQRHWSGSFDGDRLQLYENLVDEAFLGKLLTPQSHGQLRRWISGMWDQPGLFDAPNDREKRTFSAFLYQTAQGGIGLGSGLPKYKVMIQRERRQQAGELTTPIFSKTCWFQDVTMISSARRQFDQEAMFLLSGEYLQMVRALKGLPSILDGSDYWVQAQQLEQKIGVEAGQVLRWYGRLWNVGDCKMQNQYAP